MKESSSALSEELLMAKGDLGNLETITINHMH